MHHLKIDGSPVLYYKNERQYDKQKFELNRIILNRKDITKQVGLNESYNSESLSHILETGCCISIEENSNYSLKYSTSLSHKIPFGITPIFFLLTVGIFPVFETTEASIKFQISDKSSKKVVKEYTYHADHKYMTSWLSLIAATFLWGDEWNLAMFNNHDYPQKMIASKFEKDFQLDIESQKFSFQRRSILKHKTNSNFAILPVTYSHPKDKETSIIIRDKIETVFVNKNFTVLERTKLNEIVKEFELSQSGLTRSAQIKLGGMFNANNLIFVEILELAKPDGKLEFSVKNLEIESGKILWKYEFILDEINISDSINKAMHELETKI